MIHSKKLATHTLFIRIGNVGWEIQMHSLNSTEPSTVLAAYLRHWNYAIFEYASAKGLVIPDSPLIRYEYFKDRSNSSNDLSLNHVIKKLKR